MSDCPTPAVIEALPDTRFHRTTIVSSVRRDGTMILFVFEGALDENLFSPIFSAPSLQPGDIVVLDNRFSRKGSGVIKPIEAVGASVLFLPSYSPDRKLLNGWGRKSKPFHEGLKYAPKSFRAKPSPLLSTASHAPTLLEGSSTELILPPRRCSGCAPRQFMQRFRHPERRLDCRGLRPRNDEAS
jgi:hypothetical protein